MDVKEYNKTIIHEFRTNEGIVGGPFKGAKLLLLHSIGAKSGEPRVNPLAYFEDDEEYLIVASYAGAPTNPPWYYNLVANTDARIEVGTEEISVTAEVVDEPERTTLYDRIATQAPTFAEYRAKTTRAIPIVRLSISG